MPAALAEAEAGAADPGPTRGPGRSPIDSSVGAAPAPAGPARRRSNRRSGIARAQTGDEGPIRGPLADALERCRAGIWPPAGLGGLPSGHPPPPPPTGFAEFWQAWDLGWCGNIADMTPGDASLRDFLAARAITITANPIAGEPGRVNPLDPAVYWSQEWAGFNNSSLGPT